MNQMPYTPAEFESKSFNCVHSDCRAFAAQQWGEGSAKFREVGYTAIANLRICRCIHCGTDSFWWKGRLGKHFSIAVVSCQASSSPFVHFPTVIVHRLARFSLLSEVGAMAAT